MLNLRNFKKEKSGYEKLEDRQIEMRRSER